MRSAQTKRQRQRGALTVELAVLLTFVLAPMLIGVMDFGQLLLAQAAVTRAAHVGALAASRNLDVEGSVNQFMESAGYDASLVNVATEGDRTPGTPVTVTVGYKISGMLIIPLYSISTDLRQVTGTATERQS